ncbi:MAG TPA: hypothetical protein PLX97_09235, partial [Gemmatales bacterium]|nr:hypothetical protein [Gemmatales bacterium]
MRSNFGRIDSRLLVFGLALGALIVVAVVYVAWGVGSRWWVLRELERQHPAVTVSDKVDAALTTAIAALPGDRAAGVLLTAPLSKLVPVAAYSSKTPLQLQGATLSLSNVKLKGGDQQLEIELSFSLSSEEHGVVVDGRLVAAAIPSLERSTNVGSFELVVAPIVKSWRFEKAAIRGLKLNLAPVVNALGSSLQASASKISEHIGTVKIPVVLTSGPQDLKLKSTDGAERTVRLPSLIVDRAPILIANNSLYLLLQFQGASSTSTTAVQKPTGPTKFEVLKTEFAGVVKRDFGHDLNSPNDLTVEVASKLLQELGSVLQDPRRADEAVPASITSNSHRLAARSSSASIGFFISERRLQSELTERIAESVAAIQREKLGFVSNPTVKVENQAIRLSASLSDMQVGENVGLSGRVSGIVVPVVTPSSVKIVSAFDILEIDSLQIRGWRVDPLRIVLLLQQANEVLLPSINALLLPTEVKVDAIHAGKATLPP